MTYTHSSHSADDAPGLASEASGEPDEPSSPWPGGHACRVDLILETHETDPPVTGWVDIHLRQVLELCGVEAGELTLTVVDDGRMAELHEQYRGEPGTTDVLTFDLRDIPLEQGLGARVIEGDIVVCVDEAARRAAEHSHDTRDEVLLYAVHGVMHLLGEDDHTPEGFARMHEREDDLLSRIGVGRLFGGSDPDDPGAEDRR